MYAFEKTIAKWQASKQACKNVMSIVVHAPRYSCEKYEKAGQASLGWCNRF